MSSHLPNSPVQLIQKSKSYMYNKNGFRLSPQSMLTYIHQIALIRALPEMTKALNLFLTASSCEMSFSILKRVKTYLMTNLSEDRLRQLSHISIKRNCLSKIECSNVHDQENFWIVIRFEIIFK